MCIVLVFRLNLALRSAHTLLVHSMLHLHLLHPHLTWLPHVQPRLGARHGHGVLESPRSEVCGIPLLTRLDCPSRNEISVSGNEDETLLCGRQRRLEPIAVEDLSDIASGHPRRQCLWFIDSAGVLLHEHLDVSCLAVGTRHVRLWRVVAHPAPCVLLEVGLADVDLALDGGWVEHRLVHELLAAVAVVQVAVRWHRSTVVLGFMPCCQYMCGFCK